MQWHTDFRLETANGCEVWLFNGQTVSDKVTGLKKQPAPNIAYGRKTDGSEEKGYQTIPTPGAANCGEVSDKVLGDPVFSELGRVVTDGQSLTIELTLPKGSPEGTEIYMTVDGSEPTLPRSCVPVCSVMVGFLRVLSRRAIFSTLGR